VTDVPNPKAPTSADPSAQVVASAAASKKPASRANPFVWGVGRRKSAVARVRIKPGDGKFTVNKKDVNVFFCVEKDRASVHEPLSVTGTQKSYDIFVNVRGGGTTGQAGAVVLGLARALAKASSELEPKLREHKLLSRDSRRVERKKYGRSGARRSFQFSKR